MAELNGAMGHFEEALAFCRRAGFLTHLAWTCCDYADALRERDGEGDREKAAACWTGCLQSPAIWACVR